MTLIFINYYLIIILKKKDNVEVIDDKEKLLSIYSEVIQQAKFTIDKLWESVKFFTTITSALLTASIGGFIVITKEKLLDEQIIIVFILIFIPIIIIAVSIIGILNSKREYLRFLTHVTILDKIQEKLGFYNEIKFLVYPKDKFQLPEKFIKNAYNSSEDFIKSAFKNKNSLRFYFKVLHIIFIILSSFMLLIGLNAILW